MSAEHPQAGERPHPGDVYVVALADPQIKRRIQEIAFRRRPLLNAGLLTAVFAVHVGVLASLLLGGPRAAMALLPVLALNLVLAWYLMHEAAHRGLARSMRHNAVLGEALSWINGMSWFRFGDYGHDHLRHHREHVDLVGTRIEQLLARLPGPLRGGLLAAEACYLPVLHQVVKADQAVDLWRGADPAATRRIAVVGIVTTALLGTLAAMNPAGLAVLLVAVMVRIHVVRLVDAFQHTYDEVDPALPAAGRDKAYEQLNTFSLSVSRRHAWLNLLLLNFGYHNAHHAVPSCPWYRLPEVDRVLRRRAAERGLAVDEVIVTWKDLLRTYHCHRLDRVLRPNQGRPDGRARGRAFMAGFPGAFTDKLLG